MSNSLDFIGYFIVAVIGGLMAMVYAADFSVVSDRLLLCIFAWASFVSVCIARVVVYIFDDDRQEQESEWEEQTAHTVDDTPDEHRVA